MKGKFFSILIPSALLGITAYGLNTLPLDFDRGNIVLRQHSSDEQREKDYISSIIHTSDTPAPARKGVTGSTIYGFMSYLDQEDFMNGFYEIEPSGKITRMWEYQFASAGASLMSGWIKDGKLCGLAALTLGSEDLLGAYAYQEIDLATGEVLLSRDVDFLESFVPYFYAAAYVPAENKIYGFGKEERESGDYYFKCAPADRPEEAVLVKKLNQPGDRCNSLCYSVYDNCLYGVNTFGKFVRITTDGTITELFDVPIDNLSTGKSALTVSPRDGYLIWNPSVYDTVSEFHAIYPDEKRIEKMHRFQTDCQFTMFVSPDDIYERESIAAPSYTGNTFEKNNLNGNLKFTLPSATIAGEPVSGDLSWTLFDNGEEKAKGTAAAGSEIEIPAETTQGYHTFRLDASDGTKSGYPGIAHIYVGNDTPLPPEGVTLTKDEITWKPVTAGCHNGYLDVSAIRYKVYLNDELIATTTSTSCPVSIDAEKLQEVYYARVIAEANGLESEAGVSEKAVLGRANPLPLIILPTRQDADMVTIINADGSPDYGIWRYSDQWDAPCFASGWSYNQPDDWLIMPAAEFPSNQVVYQVALDAARGGYIGQREYFEVWAGTEPTPEAMTIPVISKTRAQKYDEWKEYSGVFTVPKAGVYYVAVRSVSEPDQKDLIVKNIRITATDQTLSAPSAVGNLSIVSSSDADLTATIKFNLPQTYINGEAIGQDASVTAKASAGAEAVEISGAPGSEQTLTVPTMQGDNYITVTSIVNNIEGQTAEISVFTGMDHLSYVNDFYGEISEDNMSVDLSWTAPTESLNGGYVASSGIVYRIGLMNSDGSFKEDPIVAGTDITSYTFTLPEGSAQNSYRIGIAPENAAGISPARSFLARIIGTPHKLPITETFENMEMKYPIITSSSPDQRYSESSLTWCQPELVDPLFANPDIQFAVIGYTDAESARVRIGLPKISTVGAESPSATLKIWNGAGAAQDMAVYAIRHGMKTPEKIADIKPGEGWEDIVIDIPAKFADCKWMNLYIDGNLPSSTNYLIIGGYTFSPTSGVESILTKGYVKSAKGEISIKGEAGESFTIHGIDGIKVASGIIPDSNEITINVSKGVYFVTLPKGSTSIIVP